MEIARDLGSNNLLFRRMSQEKEKHIVIFPHQLFDALPEDTTHVHIIEEPLFFGDSKYYFQFHIQKLVLHRATMQAYADSCREKGFQVAYYNYKKTETADIVLDSLEAGTIYVFELADFELHKRVHASEKEIVTLDSPGFLNTPQENKDFFEKKSFRMQTFYSYQRTKLDILMDEGKPIGGQWSFDAENRKKIPKSMYGELPTDPAPINNSYIQEAKEYVAKLGTATYGTAEAFFYPVTRDEALDWLEHFLQERFALFGPYEDAMHQGSGVLYHSVLSPLLNCGLLTPDEVVNAALNYYEHHAEEIALATIEGFIRQIIGWREFMKATYDIHGVSLRNSNDWKHTNPLPKEFYTGKTGLIPVDDVISRTLDTGYAHHIERLMVLGNIMFLLRIDPEKVYAWFMELFIDAYDWVMVGNVYGMSQDAADGLLTTKPYFSGSNYIKKMSNFEKGEWYEIWDALYWTFIFDHLEELSKNPRWAFMVAQAKKMDSKKKDVLTETAQKYTETLFGNKL